MLIFLSMQVQGQHPVINEIQYVNKHTLTDSFGETPDWIEIFNPSANSINLKGYLLNDENDIEEAWTFPDTLLSPKAFLLLYASGHTKQVSNQLHLPFKLGQLKDTVYLFSPEHELIDICFAKCVPPDLSLGCKPNGAENRFILSPTPGYSNEVAETHAINYQEDSLWLSIGSGFYQNDTSIVAMHLVQENQIRYTFNADDVDFESALYTNDLELNDINESPNRFANFKESIFQPGNKISKANVLRIQSFSEGCPASKELVETYFVEEDYPSWYHSLPVVSLVTDEDNLFNKEEGIYVEGNAHNFTKRGKAWERPVHIEVFDSTFQSMIKQHAGIRIHGGFARWFDQKSLRLYARSKYGKDSFVNPGLQQKKEIPGFKKLLLRNVQVWSGAMFTDELCQHLVEDLNIDYNAAESAVVYINGEYWGVYSLREFFDENYVASNYQIGNPELDISFSMEGIEEFSNYLANNSVNEENFLVGVNEIIDVESVIDYYIAQFYLANQDYINNSRFWKETSQNTKWRPYFYDLDFSFPISRWDELFTEFLNPTPGRTTYSASRTDALSTLLQNKEFRAKFHGRFVEILNDQFSPGKVLKLIDSYHTKYLTLVNDHTYRWGIPQDIHSWNESIAKLRTYAILRPVELHQLFQKYFGNPFTVYPNPSNGRFQIAFNNDVARAKINIYSLQGKKIFEKLGINADEIVVLDLPSGVYILRVLQDKIWYSEKLIVNTR